MNRRAEEILKRLKKELEDRIGERLLWMRRSPTPISMCL